MCELPDTSRFLKAIRNDAYSVEQHQMADLADLLVQVLYQSSISAAAGAGKEYRKLTNKRPKPLDRPVVKEKEKEAVKRVFTKPQDLNGIMTRRKAVWVHTEICQSAQMHPGDEIPVCGCPQKEVNKDARRD